MVVYIKEVGLRAPDIRTAGQRLDCVLPVFVQRFPPEWRDNTDAGTKLVQACRCSLQSADFLQIRRLVDGIKIRLAEPFRMREQLGVYRFQPFFIETLANFVAVSGVGFVAQGSYRNDKRRHARIVKVFFRRGIPVSVCVEQRAGNPVGRDPRVHGDLVVLQIQRVVFRSKLRYAVDFRDAFPLNTHHNAARGCFRQHEIPDIDGHGQCGSRAGFAHDRTMHFTAYSAYICLHTYIKPHGLTGRNGKFILP